jgi:hypothetical protein
MPAVCVDIRGIGVERDTSADSSGESPAFFETNSSRRGNHAGNKGACVQSSTATACLGGTEAKENDQPITLMHLKGRRSWVVAISVAAAAWMPACPFAGEASRNSAPRAASGESSKPPQSAAPSKPGSHKNTAHPPTTTFDRAVDPSIIPTAPPIAKNEQMSPSPGEHYVWVPGHYSPVQRVWTWIPGKWSLPPDPRAVWIPGRYDVQTKRWTPGYWQPGDPYPVTDAPPPGKS